jgi:hypothetical protein
MSRRRSRYMNYYKYCSSTCRWVTGNESMGTKSMKKMNLPSKAILVRHCGEADVIRWNRSLNLSPYAGPHRSTVHTSIPSRTPTSQIPSSKIMVYCVLSGYYRIPGVTKYSTWYYYASVYFVMKADYSRSSILSTTSNSMQS